MSKAREVFDEHMDAIALRYVGGAKPSALAIDYGVSAPTISNWLIKTGYKRRKKGRVPAAMKARARELSGRGYTSPAIAEVFRTSKQNVEAWIAEEPTPPRERVARRRAQRAEEIDLPNRHKMGKWWTDEQKGVVAGLLESGNTPSADIYWLTGASRTRQQRIWRELGVGEFPLARPYDPCPPAEVIAAPPPEPVMVTADTTQLELSAFRRGVQAALAEANRLAIAGGQPPIAGIEDRVTQLERMSDDEFEEEMKRMDALKEFLSLPPAERE